MITTGAVRTRFFFWGAICLVLVCGVTTAKGLSPSASSAFSAVLDENEDVDVPPPVKKDFDPNDETTKNGVTLFSSADQDISTTPTTLSRDLTTVTGSCISEYENLKAALERTANVIGATVTLCPGTINVLQTIHVSNMMDLVITCAQGPAVAVVTGSPCILNKTAGRGQLLRLEGNGVTLNGIQFQNGSSDHHGGGAVHIQGNGGFGAVQVWNCRFVNNEAKGGNGGALRITHTGCVVSIAGSTFINNRTVLNGGAISFFAADNMCRMLPPFRRRHRHERQRRAQLRGKNTVTHHDDFNNDQLSDVSDLSGDRHKVLEQQGHGHDHHHRRRLIFCPLRVVDCTFGNNRADSYGGAIDSNVSLCTRNTQGQQNNAGACSEVAIFNPTGSVSCTNLL